MLFFSDASSDFLPQNQANPLLPIIGNKKFSSWALRAGIGLKHAGRDEGGRHPRDAAPSGWRAVLSTRADSPGQQGGEKLRQPLKEGILHLAVGGVPAAGHDPAFCAGHA